MKYLTLLKSNNPSLDSIIAELYANQALLSMEQKINNLAARRNGFLLEKNTLECSIKLDDSENWINKMHTISKNLKMVEVEIELANEMKKEWFS